MGGLAPEFEKQVQGTGSALVWPGLGWETGSAVSLVAVPEHALRSLVQNLTEIVGELASARAELERVRKELEAAQQVTRNVSQDPLAAVKSMIVGEISHSSESVFPGTIALKYNIEFQTVQKAIKELRDAGVLES